MNKIVTALFFTLISIHVAYAEDISTTETGNDIESETGVYVTLQPMLILGGTLEEEEEVLSGGRGYGFGLEVGYYFTSRFGVELAANNSTNTVSKESGEEATGLYYSVALNLVYRQHITGPLFGLLKAGYEWEKERVVAFDINENDTAVDYAIGVAYELNDRFALMIQYESSTMDSLRGDAVFVGAVEYSF